MAEHLIKVNCQHYFWQIQFLDHIVVPVYRTLANLHPAAEEPYQVAWLLIHADAGADTDEPYCCTLMNVIDPQLWCHKGHLIVNGKHQVVLVNKKKWTVAGEVLASRGERQKDVMDIFQVLFSFWKQMRWSDYIKSTLFTRPLSRTTCWIKKWWRLSSDRFFTVEVGRGEWGAHWYKLDWVDLIILSDTFWQW